MRAISAPLLFFYVLGDVLGSGIYALTGVMAAQVGGAFWTSFVVGVAAAMLTGFAYAELITKYPHAAGAADELEADLMVIGGRDKGAMQAIVLGSVAYRVLHHAPCPVLVTR